MCLGAMTVSVQCLTSSRILSFFHQAASRLLFAETSTLRVSRPSSGA